MPIGRDLSAMLREMRSRLSPLAYHDPARIRAPADSEHGWRCETPVLTVHAHRLTDHAAWTPLLACPLRTGERARCPTAGAARAWSRAPGPPPRSPPRPSPWSCSSTPPTGTEANSGQSSGFRSIRGIRLGSPWAEPQIDGVSYARSSAFAST
ncbi:hypothetical protein GCM10010405_28280 [Streptomyces macrosporus]|uniref:Uncharacterized protein n=1 Tax=Streptomyces macrosporus TaxID=44032 RepID=A0ABN3K091_9ACTN